jgi:hypothetical protein
MAICRSKPLKSINWRKERHLVFVVAGFDFVVAGFDFVVLDFDFVVLGLVFVAPGFAFVVRGRAASMSPRWLLLGLRVDPERFHFVEACSFGGLATLRQAMLDMGEAPFKLDVRAAQRSLGINFEMAR